MKITKSQLKQIIKEEIAKVSESPAFADDPYKDIGTSETIHDAAVDSLVLGHPIGGDLLNRLDMVDRDKPEERQQVYVGLMKAADKARRFVEQGFDGPSIVEELKGSLRENYYDPRDHWAEFATEQNISQPWEDEFLKADWSKEQVQFINDVLMQAYIQINDELRLVGEEHDLAQPDSLKEEY